MEEESVEKWSLLTQYIATSGIPTVSTRTMPAVPGEGAKVGRCVPVVARHGSSAHGRAELRLISHSLLSISLNHRRC
jgi:hypothetical protein